MKGFALCLLSGAIVGVFLTAVNSDQYAPPTCPEPNGTTITMPNPDDCSSFYTCVGRDPVLLPCLNGTWFNPSIGVCDWPNNIPDGICKPPPVTTKSPMEAEMEDSDEDW